MVWWRFKKEKVFLSLVFVFLLFVSPQFSFGADSKPIDIIKTGSQEVLQVLREPQGGNETQRRDKILNIVSQYFNFEEMAKRSLGRPWKDQPPQKRQEFAQLFKQLLYTTYISRIEHYTGSNEQIFYDYQRVQGDYALVKTHILYQGNSNVSIDYRLQLEGGEWKVYDVVVEGMSFVENYRGQFASILANESFDSLLSRLRQKVEHPS
jgi:phospholipid transport system substrate-binding protein